MAGNSWRSVCSRGRFSGASAGCWATMDPDRWKSRGSWGPAWDIMGETEVCQSYCLKKFNENGGRLHRRARSWSRLPFHDEAQPEGGQSSGVWFVAVETARSSTRVVAALAPAEYEINAGACQDKVRSGSPGLFIRVMRRRFRGASLGLHVISSEARCWLW
jgi:hypothetical protein